MEKELFNITLSVVIEEIENILPTYPKYPYQQVFSGTGLRQDLVAYVLSHVPNKYTVLEEKKDLKKPKLSVPYSTQNILEIEHYIHLGIHDLLHNYSQKDCDLQPINNVNYFSSSTESLEKVDVRSQIQKTLCTHNN